MAAAFAIAATIVILGWLWFYVVRPILEDFGIIRTGEPVKPSQVIMSRQPALLISDQPDRPADRLSVSADRSSFDRLEVDRTRTALIEELLYRGWTITDFRRERIFRGDNNEISAEVEAARKRLGIESAEPRTPIAKRPTSATFAPDVHR